ncbi:Zinc finger, CCHC-type, partial [Parasponia andersonii]
MIIEHKIEDNERIEILLQSLPDSYDQLIINVTSNATTLVFNDLTADVLEEENRCKNNKDRLVSSQQVEVLTMRGRSIKRGPSGSQSHSRSKSRSKKNVKCYHCGKKGHIKRECWQLKKNRDSRGKDPESSNAQENVANTSNDEEILEWFHTNEPNSGGSVFMSNDHALEIAGIGTIKIKMYDDTLRTIQEVRHVKGLKKNLLSLGYLNSLGCKTRVENGIMKIMKGTLVVMKAEKITVTLYMLKGDTLMEAETSIASTNSGEESMIMWH